MAVITKDIEKIELTAKRISSIIKGLRSFSRDGSQDPFEKAKLNAILEDVMELCQTRFTNHGVDLQILPHEDIELECRTTQIGQVLFNLLGNAYDAIQNLPEKWIKLIIEKKDDSWVWIRVVDAGKGIPAEIRAKILEPFFTTKGVGKGTGLGLSISKGIVESHSGTFEIDVDYPNTCFLIKLPLKNIQA